MNIKPIKNSKDYQAALKRIEELWEAKKNTSAGDEIEVLATLVEAYETKKYEILPPNPIEAIKFRLEQMGYSQKDLAKIIGPNRASEILHGKRNLTINMIRILQDKLNISAEVLVN